MKKSFNRGEREKSGYCPQVIYDSKRYLHDPASTALFNTYNPARDLQSCAEL